MKNTILTLAFVFSMLCNAQNFQGYAVYESKTSMQDINFGGRDMTPEMKKNMEERIKKASEKTFVLNFNKTESIYKEQEKLEAPGQGQASGMGRMWAAMAGLGGTYYKNINEKKFTVDKELLGKPFLVKDTIQVLKWEISSETKQIGNYLCMKATTKKKINQSDFRNYRRKKEEPKLETAKDTVKKEEPKKTTNFMDGFEIPKEKEITAWFTMDIPVSHGPDEYWGLPGLILEVSDDRTVLLCSKLVLNPKEKVEIKPITKGDAVSQAEYDKILKEKMEEMRQMRSQPGGGGGGARRF
jgi:GLPGLI family protein